MNRKGDPRCGEDASCQRSDVSRHHNREPGPASGQGSAEKHRRADEAAKRRDAGERERAERQDGCTERTTSSEAAEGRELIRMADHSQRVVHAFVDEQQRQGKVGQHETDDEVHPSEGANS